MIQIPGGGLGPPGRGFLVLYRYAESPRVDWVGVLYNAQCAYMEIVFCNTEIGQESEGILSCIFYRWNKQWSL